MNSIFYIVLIFLLQFNLAQSKLTTKHLAELEFNKIHQIGVDDQIRLNDLRPQKSFTTRNTRLLDGNFKFCLDSERVGFKDSWQSESLPLVCKPENYYEIPVPSAFNSVTSNKTVRDYVGWFWYQTTFGSYESKPEKFLQFENVNYMAIVWLQPLDSVDNRAPPAQLLGSHVGGHLPFIFNISDNIKKRDRRKFRLTIAVTNQLTQETIPSGTMYNLTEQVGYEFFKFAPDFDFFHYAGILGSIRIIYLNKLHIASVDVFDHDNFGDFIKFNVCLRGLNSLSRNDSLSLSGIIYHKNDDRRFPIASLVSTLDLDDADPCELLEFDSRKFEQYRWSLSNGNPNHYSKLLMAEFELLSSDFEESYDLFELRFGLRENFKKKRPNNYLQGFGMHHEQLFSGRTMSSAAIMKDMYLLKQTYANVIRTSHYPYSEEYLDHCDENGIFVIAECQAVGLRSGFQSAVKLMLHKQLLKEMMQRDHHHPSIIMWSLANEPSSQLNESLAYFESLVEYSRDELLNYTSNKLLTAAIAQSHSGDKIGHLLDLIMVNRYYAWYDYTAVLEAIKKPLKISLLGWAQKYGQSKPIMISEYGADTLAGIHRQSTGDMFSEEFQSSLLQKYNEVFNELRSNHSNSINFYGSMIWNFADFDTHESLMRVGGNKKGIFTQDRQPKLSFKLVQDAYRKRLCAERSENQQIKDNLV